MRLPFDQDVRRCAVCGQLAGATLGAVWNWGGAARLYGSTTKAPLGTAARYGYIEGPGAQRQALRLTGRHRARADR